MNEKGYKAIINFTLGLGAVKTTVEGQNFKEVTDKVEEFKNKSFCVIGEYKNPCITKIVFNYPSGKSFTKYCK